MLAQTVINIEIKTVLLYTGCNKSRNVGWIWDFLIKV